MTATARYIVPTRSDERFSRALGWLVRHGVSVFGSRVLAVRGRRSGELRTTVVNVLEANGQRYLVAPRGETQWVRNLRVAGKGQLRVGKRVEGFTYRELADDEKPLLLRAYLKRWKFEIGMFFQGVGPDAPDAKLLEIAPGYPVLRVSRPG